MIRCNGAVVGEHARQFGRDHTAFDPWHYLPVLVRKPGALRNGAPFRDWALPSALARIRRRLGAGAQADRQFVTILAAVPTEGIDAVALACEEALAGGAVSAVRKRPTHRARTIVGALRALRRASTGSGPSLTASVYQYTKSPVFR